MNSFSHTISHVTTKMGNIKWATAAAKSHQSCPTLLDFIDGSPPGSPVPGTLQARTLEWVAISFSNAGKWKVKVKSLSHVRLLATPWTAAYQAPPSMGFSRQENWSGVPLPSPFQGSLVLSKCLFFLATPQAHVILVPQTGIEPVPPAGEAGSLNHWTAREVPPFLSF